MANMDQDTAQMLFAEGATLVFLNVPEGTEFGMDYNSWEVGPKFKGVKMIPPGIHFVYYSAVSSDHTVAPRTGFFHNFQQREVLIKKWDPKIEDISDVQVSEEEQERVEQNKKELDQYLGAYPYESYKRWVSLTDHITPSVMSRILPANGRICAVTEFVSKMSNSADRAEERRKAAALTEEERAAALDSDGLPHMEPMPGSELHFTPYPKRLYPEGATPEEITRHSMDFSYALETILQSVYPENHLALLGEIQLSFVMFLLGQVYDGFEQWKSLLQLLCRSDAAISQLVQLYTAFINVLHYQVREVPEDFFVDIVSRNNFLTSTLQIFFSNLQNNTDIPNTLIQKGNSFRTHLEKKFQWDFLSNPEDEEPVIVEDV